MQYIFDLDGTLRVTGSGKPVPNESYDQNILPSVREKLRYINDYFVISRQGGVSCGYMTEWECWQIIYVFFTEEIGYINRPKDVRLMFYHDAGSLRQHYHKRTKTDVILELIAYWYSGRRKKEYTYIGNEFADRDEALAAGISFQWAHEFFNWSAGYVEETERGYFPKEWMKKWREFKNENNSNSQAN